MPLKNEYIIENDVDEIEEQQFTKQMRSASLRNSQLPDNYEIEEEPMSPSERVSNEIYETAKEEGLVSDNGPLGGEGATPEQVIDALMEEEMPEGAIKNKKEYEDKKVEEFKKVSATRELLFSRTQRTVIVPVETVLDGVKTSLEFEVRRLSESENTHLFNHKLFGKELQDMTDEEYLSSTKFRSDVLAKAVVNPKLTAEEWRTKVDYGMLTAVYEAVNRVLTEADDATLFQ